MAKISHREKILLGYTSNSVSTSPSRRSSEVDFSDVFGGPPRCSSTQEYYHQNEIDCVDDEESSGDGLRSSWSGGLSEKPVFGDEIGVRKRLPSGDFFDDIFGGDQPLLSCSLSPRVLMPGRNPFSSAPGSRSRSPSKKPLSPASDPCASPSKLRSSSYQPSALSRQSSSDGNVPTSDFNKSNEDIQFHFSIYKWASKGVPFVMSSRKRSPSRSKGSKISERYLSNSEKIINDFLVIKSGEGHTSANDSVSPNKRHTTSTSQVIEPDYYNDDRIRYAMSVQCELEDDIENVPPNVSEVLDVPQESSNVVRANSSEKGSGISIFHTREKESMFNDAEKSCLDYVSPSYISNKSVVHESFVGTQDDLNKSEVAKKVKDFVRIFNQDSFTKVKSSVVGQSCNWKRKDTTNSQVENEAKSSSTKINDQTKATYVHLDETSLDSPELGDGESFIVEQQYTINVNGMDFGISSSTSAKEPNIGSVKPSAPKVKSNSDDSVDKGMVQDIDTHSAIEDEENQRHERKVLLWSKGKEGNIRALLSTMQYVLWPNSGWKPIPLVDIIEANSMKRAYQRALLCLHPDKLQQKGAAPYQKFIAEKVFDILQEAWDQFNSLGLV